MPYKDRDEANASSRRTYQRHREAHLAGKRRWQAQNPDYMKNYAATHRAEKRASMLLRTYGLTVAQYDALLAQQAGVCAICSRSIGQTRGGRERPLFVDHDKDTGVVRGLLCGDCNMGIGQFRHDPALLEKAIAYLDFPPARFDHHQLSLLPERDNAAFGVARKAQP